jgi:hypothetical protein
VDQVKLGTSKRNGFNCVSKRFPDVEPCTEEVKWEMGSGHLRKRRVTGLSSNGPVGELIISPWISNPTPKIYKG